MKKRILALVVSAMFSQSVSAAGPYCGVEKRLTEREWASKTENIIEVHCVATSLYNMFKSLADLDESLCSNHPEICEPADPEDEKTVRECRALSIVTGRVIYEKYGLVDPCG